MAIDIGRRQLIFALGGSAAAWPLAARAQQGERMWRIVVLGGTAAVDPQNPARMGAFLQGLRQLGWIDGRSDGSRATTICDGRSVSAFPESDRQPPQAAAPLWAKRRHDGRPRTVEKWKR
jgi:hypothetical protein